MRRRLLLVTGATTALVLAALLVPLALLARGHAADRATADATQRAQSVAAVVGGELGGGGRGDTTVRAVLAGVNGADLPRTSVLLPDGRVLGPAARVTDAVRLARTGRAFTYAPEGGGRTVLVPVQGIAGGTAVVQVVVPEQMLYAGTLASWLPLAGLGAGLTLLGLLVADRLGARLVGAARRLAAVADRLAAGDLSARAAPEGPQELRLVAASLNGLADRIHAFRTAERENAADLAHRLRTPLAVLRLDAEGLRDPEEAERIGSDAAALEHGVDEVIRAARRPLRDPAAAVGDLAEATCERAAFWLPLAQDQDRRVAVATPAGPVRVRVGGEDLRAAVDALIGNVLDHTPPGTPWRIAVSADGRLVVDDAGPGFPPGRPALRGRSGAGSTGLGLDIVRQAAEESGGSVELGRSPAGGARVTAVFRPAPGGAGEQGSRGRSAGADGAGGTTGSAG